MIRFEIDKKLDNKREILSDFHLIYLKFRFGIDENIIRENIKYKSYSGYCLDAVQKPNESGFHTVSIEDIGKVQQRGKLYEIYCYEDLEKEAMKSMKKELMNLKNRIIFKFINSINWLPV